MEYSTSMSKNEQKAFQAVTDQCRIDVTKLCGVSSKTASLMERNLAFPNANNIITPKTPFLSTASTHPFLRGMFEEGPSSSSSFMASSGPPPPSFIIDPFQEIESLLDTFFQPLFDFPPSIADNHHRGTTSSMIVVDLTPKKKQPPCPFSTILDTVVTLTPPEHFDQVSVKLNNKGTEVVERAAAANNKNIEEQDQMFTTARRLQEISPEDLHNHRSNKVFLPFTSTENECLIDNYQKGRVTKNCATALHQLHTTRTQYQKEQLDELDALAQVTVLYILILIILTVLICKRKSFIQQQMKLRNKILRVVYSQPSIKRNIENVLGKNGSIGNTPPLFYQPTKKMKTIKMIVMIGLIMTYIFAPAYMLPLSLCMAIIALIMVIVQPKPKEAQICTCCCCGMTTDNNNNNNYIDVDCCCDCKCCNGTGVCSVACADCCDGDADTDNDDEDCCCKDKETTITKRKTVLSSTDNKTVVYEGVPIQVI